VITYCTGCATPLGATDSSCPTCTTAKPRGGPVRPRRQSPAGAAVPSASRSGGPAAVGTITGPVICDRITATGTGQRLLATGAAKGLARIVTASIRAGSSLERQQSTEVRRFRVTEVSGRQVDCELVGELAGAQLHQGDVVDVFGRTTRHGTVRVRAVIVTSNQARITARPHFGFVLARIANVAAVALPAACLLAVAYLLVNR
jgi:ribosomal protein S28E/S33